MSPLADTKNSGHQSSSPKTSLQNRKYAFFIGIIFVVCLVAVTGYILGYKQVSMSLEALILR